MKPEIHLDEDLWDLETETALPIFRAFVGLWSCADREGRFEWRPRALKAYILPYWEGDFSRVLDALATRGFVGRYASGTREYGVVRTFRRHQAINNKETASELPEPPKDLFDNVDLPTREEHDNNATATRTNPYQGEPNRTEPITEPSRAEPAREDSPHPTASDETEPEPQPRFSPPAESDRADPIGTYWTIWREVTGQRGSMKPHRSTLYEIAGCCRELDPLEEHGAWRQVLECYRDGRREAGKPIKLDWLLQDWDQWARESGATHRNKNQQGAAKDAVGLLQTMPEGNGDGDFIPRREHAKGAR